MKANLLAIKYAENRLELRSVKTAIKLLNESSEEGFVRLDVYHEYWYNEGCGFDDGGDKMPEYWRGWVAALENADFVVADDDVGHSSLEELALAVLMDEKKEIGMQCGILRRQIFSAGMALLIKDGLNNE